MGVAGGLLQFAAVSYVAFSGPSSTPRPPEQELPPPPEPSETRTQNGFAGAQPTANRFQGKADSEAEPGGTASEAPQDVSEPADGPTPAAPAASAGDPAPEVKIAEVAPTAPAPPPAPAAKRVPDPPPAPALSLPAGMPLSTQQIEQGIRDVFGAAGEKAVQVARCESELKTTAKNGLFLGLFQLGKNERIDYGDGKDALSQINAAYQLYLARGWQPWQCA